MIRKIKNYIYKTKMKKQRIKRKYSDDMCWDLQYTLLEILPKMIETLRKAKNSYPELKFEEVDTFDYSWIQNNLKELDIEYKQNDYDKPSIKDPFTRWQLILKRISYCLIQADENQTVIINKYEKEYTKQLWNIDNEKEEEKLSTKKWFKKHTSVSKYDNKGKPLLYTFDLKEVNETLKKNYIEECNRINNYRNDMKTEAFNLINKYFWNLWD